MEVHISKIDSLHDVEINGVRIPNVTDYKIQSSMHGGTELELKIVIQGNITEFETSGTRNPWESVKVDPSVPSVGAEVSRK